jgi:hypothetical protein
MYLISYQREIVVYLKKHIPWLSYLPESTIIYFYKMYYDDCICSGIMALKDPKSPNEAKQFSNYLDYCLQDDNPFVVAYNVKQKYDKVQEGKYPIYW